MNQFGLESPTQDVREGRLLSLMSLATTPMVVADHGRRLVEANPTACELLGGPREAILSRRIDDLTADEGGFDLERFWSRFMQDGRANGSYPAKRLDGQLCPVVYAATANVLPGLHMAIFATGANETDAVDVAPRLRRTSHLTPREREILQMIADGLTDREVASRLRLSPATARTHARNMIGKLGAHTRAQAVAIAIRRGEIAA